MTSTTTTRIGQSRQRTRIGALCAAGAIAVFAMIVTATDANAEPQTENQIKSGCADAGGTYQTTPGKKGVPRFSQCTYTDIDGDTYTDSYQSGQYLGTQEGTCGSAGCKPA